MKMKLGFKRGEKGFTLVELMVVMAIMAVLSAIVLPAVTGTKQLSLDSQVKQDAYAVETGVSKVNADANVSESLTTDNTSVFGTVSSQSTSSQWPENPITTTYATEFPTVTTAISGVTLKNTAGTVIYSSNTTGFVADYTAIDIDGLIADGYLQEEPVGVDSTFSTAKAYHNYLWLLKKANVEGTSDAGRVVEVFKLVTIATTTTDALTYQIIY